MKRILNILKPRELRPPTAKKGEWTGYSDINGNKIHDGDEIDLIDTKKHRHFGMVRINSRDKEVYFLDKSPYAPYHYEQLRDIIRKNHGNVELRAK